MKKWWIMVATVMAAVVILAVCIYGLPSGVPGISPSGTAGGSSSMTNSQLWTTLPPETTEETLPWEWLIKDPISYIYEDETRELNGDVTVQVLPETVENPDGLPVLKWVIMLDSYSFASKKTWNEAAVVELNQMLSDKDLPYRVQFIVLTSNRYNKPRDWFANPDVLKELEEADLIYSYYTYKEMEEWLLPITDHIYGDAQPSLADALPDPLCWLSKEVNGEIYGIPKGVNSVTSQGWRVDTDFMEKHGLTFEDFNRSFWEMDELFAEIYEKNGNQPFLHDDFFGHYGGAVGQDNVRGYLPMPDAFRSSTYQNNCLCFSIDLQAEKPTVVNMLETEMFIKTRDAAFRYLSAGYVSDECYEICYESSMQSSKPYLDHTGEFYRIPSGPIGLNCLNNITMTGISAKSAHQEQALSLLEQIIIDDTLRLQLCYGKEGRDYTLDEGNVYSLITQEDGSCYFMDFLSPQAYFFDFISVDEQTYWMVYSTSYYSVIKHEGKTRLESYRADLKQATFSYCPAVFDYSVLDAELTAIGQVLGDYCPMYQEVYYSEYYEEYYPKMLEKLEEAGMGTVIAEMQRQLDAWIAEHPDWNLFS